MESRHAINVARDIQGFPLLPPFEPLPQYPNLPRLSDTKSEEEEGSYHRQQSYDDDPDLEETLVASIDSSERMLGSRELALHVLVHVALPAPLATL